MPRLCDIVQSRVVGWCRLEWKGRKCGLYAALSTHDMSGAACGTILAQALLFLVCITSFALALFLLHATALSGEAS